MSAWYAVYTLANSEGRALAHLERQGYRVYLPLCEHLRRHSRRVERVSRPLFPRYLFIWFDTLDRRWRPIMSTVGVCRLVCHGDRPAPVPKEVIEEIRARETEGVFRETSPIRRLKAGDPVRISEGALTNLVGRFLRMSECDRVLVLLDLLNRQVRADLPSDAVQPA